MKKFIIASSASFVLNFVIVGIASATIITPPPTPLPTTTSECKQGGWENFGGLFKNQGDCVSFVATGGKNAPDGPSA